MLDLAESSLAPVTPRQWLLRGVITLVVVALLVGLALWLKGMLGEPTATKRQVAKISILPDTPPPPPPPKEEKKPEPPKEEPKQVMRETEVKQQETPKPANEPIKMEGQAGDGPSAFSAGTVNNEYKGGAPVVGAAGTGGSSIDRAQERLYATAVKQLLHDEIEKNLPPEAGELIATFSVWIEPDGSIRRFELTPTGDSARDTDLRSAFDQTTRRLRLPTHNGLQQPMRFKLSVRPA